MITAISRIIEEGVEAVVLLLRDRIVFMTVALSAHHGKAEPSRRRRGHAVLDRLGAILLGITTAFVIDFRIPVKAGGDLLLQRGIGKEVAGELFNRELIEGQ